MPKFKTMAERVAAMNAATEKLRKERLAREAAKTEKKRKGQLK